MNKKIDYITYKKKKYPVREIEFLQDGRIYSYKISIESLYFAIYGRYRNINSVDEVDEAGLDIDVELFYYIQDKLIFSSDKKIWQELVDNCGIEDCKLISGLSKIERILYEI